MHSLVEILQKTEKFFRDKDVPNPRLDAELLIGHVLKLKRLELYLQFDRPMEEAVLAELRPLVRRRSQREPLQHIFGEVSFADCRLKSDRRALVPRPETELLAEKIVQKFQLRAPERILDLGTGTGALALALAKAFPDAHVVAADVSQEALGLAAENRALNGLDDRVELLESDWFSALGEMAPFDLIVSNPPYLTTEEMATAAPEVVEYDPPQALVSGDDGLDALRILIAQSPRYLNSGGLLALETGIVQGPALIALTQSTDWAAPATIEDDLSLRPRFAFITRA